MHNIHNTSEGGLVPSPKKHLSKSHMRKESIGTCLPAGRYASSSAGFVLLMSSIVISAILLGVVFSVSFSGFFTRFNLLDSYNKEGSLALAEACGDIAVLKLKQDSTYSGDEDLIVGSDTCHVEIFDPTASPTIVIQTSAEINYAVSNIEIDLNSSDLSITRWREVSSF